MLDHVLSFKGKAEKVYLKIVEFNLYLIAHDGSGFDSYVVLNNLPQWRILVNLKENGVGTVTLKIFYGYVDEKKTSICPVQMWESAF